MVIIDAHTHIGNIEGNYEPLFDMAKKLGYSKLSVLSLQSDGGLLQNLACAQCKASHPGTYAFGGLDYATGRDCAEQAKNLRAMGFDGVKMLEGKPTTRRALGLRLDDPSYDAYYSYLEEAQFPVLMHVADPGTFWDKDKVPSWAVEHGWFYGENDAPYEQYYEEVEHLLAKHPKLHAIFAHFFFLSGDPAHLQRFLDSHPTVSVDVTAGIEMYEDFSKDPKFWREFFVKNRDRIIFGTDSEDSAPKAGDGTEVSVSGYAGMEIDFLRHYTGIEIYGMKLHGLGLPEDAQERIFSRNYLKYVNDAPRPLDIDALRREAAFMRRFLKSDEENKQLDVILSRL
jgi:predicted TIM-barrel fold metal-dependent hydrolase